MSELNEREKVEIVEILFEEGVELSQINKMINIKALSIKRQAEIAEFLVKNNVELSKINEIINTAALPLQTQIAMYGQNSNRNVVRRINETLSGGNAKTTGER